MMQKILFSEYILVTEHRYKIFFNLYFLTFICMVSIFYNNPSQVLIFISEYLI